MRNCIVIVLIFIYLNSFSQEKKLSYNFDYYTVYDYKKNAKESVKPVKEIFFSNSKDSTYILIVSIENQLVKKASLLDYVNHKITIFKDERILNNYNDVRLFNNSVTTDYSLEYCRNNSDYFYEINDINESNHSIIKYKKSNKKRIEEEFVFETKPSPINANHNYNFGPFVNPLWCWKFSLKNRDLITSSFVLIKGQKKHLRKLVEITNTNFTITLDSTNNTQQ